MVTKYGMSEKIGLINYGTMTMKYSSDVISAHPEATARKSQERLIGRFTVSSVSAMRMQEDHSVRISTFFTAVRALLLEKEKSDRRVFEALFTTEKEETKIKMGRYKKCTKKYMNCCEVCAHFSGGHMVL